MELPIEVMVHNPSFGLKGSKATLIRISQLGFYELTIAFGASSHRTLLPIAGTMVIAREAEIPTEIGIQFER